LFTELRTIPITSLAVLFGLAFVFLNISSCTKKPESIGLDLVNDDQNFVGIDTTFEITAYSSIEDSVRTDETTVNLLGSRFSDIFGLSNAAIYTQVRLSQVQPEFGENPVVDSTILTFVYSSSYGNIETELSLKVNEVTESFYKDSTYYADTELEISPNEMGSLNFIPTPNDTLVIDSVNYPSELRIPLNDDLANRVFDPANADSLGSSDSFLNIFKGIYVSVDDISIPGEGSILAFDLLQERSNITIYYHNDEDDSLSYPFNINLFCGRVGKFRHDYTLSSDPDFIAQVVNNDTTKGMEKLYFQGMSGIQTEIWFPGLADWIDQGNIAVNQAKLELPVYSDGISENEVIPERLVLFKYIENGELAFTADQREGDEYFNGTYSEGFNDYFFRLSRYTQSLLNGEHDYGLVLHPSGKNVRAEEVVIFGTHPTDAQSAKVKLKIIYTEIK
jgi:hypothetical protein